MWWAGTERAHALLGQTFVALRVEGEPAQWSTCDSAIAGWTWAVERLRSGPRSKRRSARVQVWLSGSLARPFIMPPVSGMRHVDEALDIANLMAPEQTGLEGPCCVHLDRWGLGVSSLATAMSQELRDALLLSARERKVKVFGIAPWWTTVLNWAIAGSKRENLIAVRDDESVTVLGGASGEFELAVSFDSMAPMAVVQSLARLAVVHPHLDRGVVYSMDRHEPQDMGTAEQRLLYCPFGAIKEPHT